MYVDHLQKWLKTLYLHVQSNYCLLMCILICKFKSDIIKMEINAYFSQVDYPPPGRGHAHLWGNCQHGKKVYLLYL